MTMMSRLLTIPLLALVGVASGVQAPRELRVSAAVSLTDALEEIARGFEAAGGPRVVLNFGPSNALARQIVEGAPADVFLSADEAQMDVVVREGAARREDVVPLLSNTLAVVVPRDSALTIRTVQDLLDPAVRRLAIGIPDAVPAGVYAKRYLEKVGLWSRVLPRIVPTRSVRAALAAVETGSVEAGIVYRSDGLAARRARIAFEVPRAEGPSIVYPAVVLPRAANPLAARSFLDYLRSAAARAVFTKHGFIPL
jgi:molybdate transport system substrate-binding protein